ncbi:MAG: bifunctional diaminohydroxyphosphoribosylaminopyrimidine deaminase/5-amino-6-(5-phosphoribosylamino)uracil reductase RibD [Pirellulales bacterium]|nr:bifunctional diaminohydroxyphosphoribosylaminopyrimidine deaminase/5-amino-6-(5-phosphoribosylamino)uracil reductase RibD [Pirellulales bacterium]
MDQAEIDLWHMRRALELAQAGQGHVEPNPMVGCVVVHGAEIIGEGWHRRFGAAHAEIEALRLAGARAAGASMFVTLEPCCHQGKTPPCCQAVINAGIRRVVIAMRDPYPEVAGHGIEQLAAAGIQVDVGLLEDEGQRLNAPYLKLVNAGQPWTIAKWAMTLDGKIATQTGASQWISGEASRRVVHALRGRVDAVIVGSGTATQDNPLLTARPPGTRTAVRIVLDSRAALSSGSQLVKTARETPVLVAIGEEAPPAERDRLTDAGCELFVCDGASPAARLESLMDELGRRRMTNVLVEGGSGVLGSLLDANGIDEVHVFVAPKLVGGRKAPSPIGGIGLAELTSALTLDDVQVETLDGDTYIRGRVRV